MRRKLYKKILRFAYNDDFWSVIGLIFSILNAFNRYFISGATDKAIFWMLVAIFCLVNLKR